MIDKVQIRNVRKSDYDFILEQNQKNVDMLSPMNAEKLQQFCDIAELLLIADVDEVPAAFLIALRDGIQDYQSENYRWFCQNYSSFLYIDRIVIDENYRGCGLGRLLYQNVFSHAYNTNVPFVTAEINIIPYNASSLKFHEKMGFHEVGTQTIRNNTVKVSLQEAAISDFYRNNQKLKEV